MFSEISLHILDILQNSARAMATEISVSINLPENNDELSVWISDNGKGMTKEQLNNCCNPFFTTKDGKHTGFGLPFFKYAALITGGHFSVNSDKCSGTKVNAVFNVSNIDCIPLGDLLSTVYSAVISNPEIRFKWHIQIRNTTTEYDSERICSNYRNLLFVTPAELYSEKKYLEKKLKNIEIYETVCADYAHCLK